MKIKFIKAFIVVGLLLCSCKEKTAYKEQLKDPELFQSAMKKLTDIIVYDIFSPPVASRVYLYPSIAAYVVMQKGYPEKYNNLSGQLNGLNEIPAPTNGNVDFHLASLHAFITVGRQLIFSEDKFIEFQNATYKQLEDAGIPDIIFKNSTTYGDQVANHILNWANDDLYNQTRTYPKHTVLEEPQFWKPTPPDYMDGIEPHWHEIRTLVLKSANHFPPKAPLDFDLTEGSPFQKQLMEVYRFGNGKDSINNEIASFWDCNPYVSHHRGHAMFATKKITPGGHWIGITAIATRKANSTFDETINAYTNVSISLFDAFISCWNEKWRSLVVRPETLINEYIDEDWMPLLQTPPFPEYTSGHSVISRAAAVALTDIFGDDFSFQDTTEIEYGLPQRDFDSFIKASEEAAISRLYGGIHYMMAIEEGVEQGQQVGDYIVSNLQTIKNPLQ